MDERRRVGGWGLISLVVVVLLYAVRSRIGGIISLPWWLPDLRPAL